MSITTTRKILKVGTSGAVTIPAKDMKRLGMSYGDEISVTFKAIDKPDQHTLEVVSIAQDLIKRHKKALKNLSQR